MDNQPQSTPAGPSSDPSQPTRTPPPTPTPQPPTPNPQPPTPNPTPPPSPYTFKDSLKNPYLRRVFVFHDIGLDRLVNTYRSPVAVTRAVTYQSCAGTLKVCHGRI
jgi:hypothetical protein